MSKELDELKEQMEIMKKKIEELEAKEKKENKGWWTPKENDNYYYIDKEGVIKGYRCDNDITDKNIINNLNYYPTKEQAERKAFEQLLHRKLEKFAYENNENEIDWNFTDKNKYYVYYDYDDNCLDVEDVYDYRDFGQVYFTSREIAKKAMNTFENDLIRFFTTDK